MTFLSQLKINTRNTLKFDLIAKANFHESNTTKTSN